MKKSISIITMFGLVLLLSQDASAMHIMEGYLTPQSASIWFALAIPFVLIGFVSIKNKVKKNDKVLILLALCGAFVFVLSALKIPSVTGSSSHATGIGLGAIMLGPWAMCVISVIVLLFQALLLAHGGVTTLGANTFSMGIVGAFSSYFIYKLLKKLGMNLSLTVFLAAFMGNMLTYVMTSFQLALAFPDGGSVVGSLLKFLGVFAVTQIPLAICEGLVTVVVFNSVTKYRKDTLVELGVI